MKLNIHYGRTIVHQTELDMPPDVTGMLRRRANAPLKAPAAQERCEFGLFGDAHRQIDLVDMARAGEKKWPRGLASAAADAVASIHAREDTGEATTEEECTNV